MHTMGYKFKPWRSPKTIADAPSILDYLNETVDEFDLRKKFNLIEKVISAVWSSPGCSLVFKSRKSREQFY